MLGQETIPFLGVISPVSCLLSHAYSTELLGTLRIRHVVFIISMYWPRSRFASKGPSARHAVLDSLVRLNPSRAALVLACRTLQRASTPCQHWCPAPTASALLAQTIHAWRWGLHATCDLLYPSAHLHRDAARCTLRCTADRRCMACCVCPPMQPAPSHGAPPTSAVT